MHEFRCAAYTIECPPVSREKVANVLLARAGRGGGIVEAAAEIARAAARAWLSPLLDTAIERLSFVLTSLFDLAMERNRSYDSNYGRENGDLDGYLGFHAALRRSYNNFIYDLSKKCKQLVRHHIDSVTSLFSQVCYEKDLLDFAGDGTRTISRCNQLPKLIIDLSGGGMFGDEKLDINDEDQEKIALKGQQPGTPIKETASKDMHEESPLTSVAESPSPDRPKDGKVVKRKDIGTGLGGRKKSAKIVADDIRSQNDGLLFGAGVLGSKSVSSYSDVFALAARHFFRFREVLIVQNAPCALISGFLTPCREKLLLALSLDLFAVNDEKIMDMFVNSASSSSGKKLCNLV